MSLLELESERSKLESAWKVTEFLRVMNLLYVMCISVFAILGFATLLKGGGLPLHFLIMYALFVVLNIVQLIFWFMRVIAYGKGTFEDVVLPLTADSAGLSAAE